MGQDICIRKDEKPLGYDWECGHEELYVRVNMYYNGSLYVGLWQKQKECEKKLELFGDLTIGVMGFLRPGQAIISDCGAKAKVAFIEKYKLGKVVGKRKINYGSYYVAEFNLARLAQLDPEGTERYLLENGLDLGCLKTGSDGFQNMELRNTISSTSIRKMVLQKDTVHIAKSMFQSAHPNITRKDVAMCVDSRLLFVLWENLEGFVQSGTESTLSRDARLLVL